MIELLNIPNKCIVNSAIPCDKIFFGPFEDEKAFVQNITWVASINFARSNVTPVLSDTIRYEEIQVIQVVLNDAKHLYDIARPIFKSIKYPTVLIACMESISKKYAVGVCNFDKGKINEAENILGSIIFSHWIHPDQLSIGAETLLNAISQTLCMESDILTMYTKIVNAVSLFQLGGLSKQKTMLIVRNMLGSGRDRNANQLLRFCDPYIKLKPDDSSSMGRYSQKTLTTQKIVYDTEDLWYCFMNDERTSKIIAGRKYKDINDLIFHICEKY